MIKNDLLKLILSWIIVISIMIFLFSDKGIYYEESQIEYTCFSDYISNCN